MNNNEIIEKLSYAILGSEMTIASIARKSKLSRPAIYGILNKTKKSIRIENVISICNALGINTYEIIGNQKPNKKGIKIPVLGTIPAGIPIEAIEDILDYEEISEDLAKTGEFFALKVKGDSMAPQILGNDIVIIRQQSDADNGDVCVVFVNGDDATLKRIKKERIGITLLPNNPTYSPMFYSNKEIEDLPVRILGKAIEIRRGL